MVTWWQRLVRRQDLERQLDAELRFHFDSAVADNLRGGMSEPEARRSARIHFGGIEQVKEECRDAQGLRWLEDLVHDLRFALRTLRKSPGFMVTAIATMALGIGANVAVFSVVNTVLLKPLNAPDADRIVQIMDVYGGVPSRGGGFPEYNAWRTQSTSFEDISAYRLDLINLTGTTYPELIPVARVSEFFRLFGAPVYQGRVFTAEEDRPGGARVAVISYAFWTRSFGDDPQIIGKSITLGNDAYTVVGILGRGFDTEQFDQLPDVWVPAQIDPETPEHGSYCNVAARLKPGVTLGEARADLRAIAEQYRRKYPESLGPKSTFSAALLRDAMVSDVRSSLLLLAGAVSFVLLIACVNIANLLLVRAEGRKREIAIRAAVGGGPVRILRQLLTESVLLSGLGGVLGILIGVTGVRALLSAYPADPLPTPWNPINLPRIGHAGSAVALDWRVVVFTVLVSLATGVLCGMLPALQASRADLITPLKESSGRSGGSVGHNRTRALLVIIEMALALVTLIGAVLLIRSYAALRLVKPGFDAHRILSMQMSLTATRFEKTAEMNRLVREGTRGIDGLAGVEATAAACCRPLELVWQLHYIVAGRPLDGPWHGFAGWTFISPQYFDVFHVPVLRGRGFTERDHAQAPGVVIINETLARLISQGASPPGRDPLTERLIIGRGMRPEYAKDPVRQIVGIVGDIRDQSLNRNPRPAMYVPIAQLPDGINAVNLRLLPIAWFVRTSVEPQSLSAAIQEQLRQVSGGLPIAGIRSMEEVETRSLARQNFNMLLMTIFGCSGLLLAAIGVYGLMAYSVQQRTQEIGIRMALGAQPGRMRNMIILQGMRLATMGVAAGLMAAYGIARLLSSFLFGLQARDPITFIVVPILLAFIALLACLLPARRATRIDPMEALRWE